MVASDTKYISYLQTISFVSILSLAIEFLLWLFFRVPKPEILNTMGIISMTGLVFIGFVGLMSASALKIYKIIDDFFSRLNKGRCVTALFFAHMFCTALFVIQDGGAKTSCITNILLLDASFGYFFAEKKKIKWAVTVGCVLAYCLCLIVSYNESKMSFELQFSKEIIPYLGVVLFVLGVNGIINYQITRVQKREQEPDYVE